MQEKFILLYQYTTTQLEQNEEFGLGHLYNVNHNKYQLFKSIEDLIKFVLDFAYENFVYNFLMLILKNHLIVFLHPIPILLHVIIMYLN